MSLEDLTHTDAGSVRTPFRLGVYVNEVSLELADGDDLIRYRALCSTKRKSSIVCLSSSTIPCFFITIIWWPTKAIYRDRAANEASGLMTLLTLHDNRVCPQAFSKHR